MGRILIRLGGGRVRAADIIDPGVGLVFHKKLGAKVKVGEPIATVFASAAITGEQLAAIEADFHKGIQIKETRKTVPKLVLEYF